MTLAPEFQHVEHLQSVIRRWVNREVRDYFSDLGGDEWDEDITTPRGSLRIACTHIDSDSLMMTHMRWQLFERIRRQAFDMPYYGIPVAGFHEARKFKPQIQLYFQEDIQDVEPGFKPVTGQLSFRLMDYDSDTITPPIAETFANRVELNFFNGGGYLWRKGRLMCSYTDRARGYQFQILSRSDTVARELVERALDVQNHTPDWKFFRVSQTQNEAERYPVIPPNERIYGEIRRTPRRRPVADVRFQFAFLDVHGLTNPVPLVDRSGLFPSALVS